MVERKCQSKHGPDQCTNPRCPEKNPQFEIPSFYSVQATRPAPSLPTPGAWTEKDTVLFKTVHGSKLYGLNHADSDDDFYVVTPTVRVARQGRKNNAKQIMSGKNDTTFVDFKTFVNLSEEGVPQALETMFSRLDRSEFFEDYRANYFASSPTVIHTYMRTMKAFSLSDTAVLKRKRHALRLAVNLEELLYTGRFNPTLSANNVARVKKYADYDTRAYFRELKQMSPIEVDWEPED